jgi:hypothetical protein
MAESAHLLLRAVASRLLVQLDLYEERLAALVDAPNITNLVAVSGLVDVMRAEAASLPQLTGVWVPFLVSHAETMRTLVNRSRANDPAVADLRRHMALLLDLKASCRGLATGRQVLP